MTEDEPCDDEPAAAASLETATDTSLLENVIDALSHDDNEEEMDMSEPYSLDSSIESLGTSARPNIESEVYKFLLGSERLSFG